MISSLSPFATPEPGSLCLPTAGATASSASALWRKRWPKGSSIVASLPYKHAWSGQTHCHHGSFTDRSLLKGRSWACWAQVWLLRGPDGRKH